MVQCWRRTALKQEDVNAKTTIGRSKGGLTTKIHAVVDALGNPLRILLTPGNVNDVVPAASLIKGPSADKLLADRAYDANKLIELEHFR